MSDLTRSILRCPCGRDHTCPIRGVVIRKGALSALPALLFLGIGSSGIAYTLQIVAQRDINPTVASIIFSLESVFGVVGGALVLGETMTLREYIGCIIVLFAVILSQLDFKQIIKKKG